MPDARNRRIPAEENRIYKNRRFFTNRLSFFRLENIGRVWPGTTLQLGEPFHREQKKDGENVGKAMTSAQQKRFCRMYLRTMDPQKAAEAVGYPDGFALLREKSIQDRLETMRTVLSAQILREDVIRQLSELAFGRTNSAVELALSPQEAGPDLQNLDLSAVAEMKVTEKGGMEIKFIDRIRALEVLCGLLGGQTGSDADAFFQALEDANQGLGEA